MSAIDNDEVGDTNNHDQTAVRNGPVRVHISPTKIIHFSDGSTMEVEEEDRVDKIPQQVVHTTHRSSVPHVEASVDKKNMSWPEWIKHYTKKGSSSVVNGMEYTGETFAYYLGITAPKYQHEIDEYNRMVVKKSEHDAEVKTWSSTNPSALPIVMEQLRSDTANQPTSASHEHEKA